MDKLEDAARLFEELLVMMPDYSKLYYQLANLRARSQAVIASW